MPRRDAPVDTPFSPEEIAVLEALPMPPAYLPDEGAGRSAQGRGGLPESHQEAWKAIKP